MIGRETILLVEDNPDDVFALQWAARKAKVELPLQVVTDGREAIEYMSGAAQFGDRHAYQLPSLIFLDLKLPFVSGHEVLAWIRQRPEFSSLPVIILSGSDESRDREQTSAAGANGYLVKPISAETLIQTLSAALVE